MRMRKFVRCKGWFAWLGTLMLSVLLLQGECIALPDLVGRSRADNLNDRHTLWDAHFHPMVSSSLSAIAYRQYDYETTLGYRSSLARWLHKHLALVYLSAGMTQPYRILLSTLRANSGLVNSQTVRRQAQDVEDALKELKTSACPV